MGGLSSRSIFISIEMEEFMSDVANPYQSPETAAVPVTPFVAQGTLTENMLIYLKGASPWLSFIGILGFISAGLTAVWGIVSFVFVPLMRQFWGEISGFEMAGAFGVFFGVAIAVFCIGAGVLMFFPSLFIYRFGERIRSYLRTGLDQELEQAFRNNKSFWKFVGIICIIFLAFIPVMIIAGIIAVVVSAFT
jgi:hypothetical protein